MNIHRCTKEELYIVYIVLNDIVILHTYIYSEEENMDLIEKTFENSALGEPRGARLRAALHVLRALCLRHLRGLADSSLLQDLRAQPELHGRALRGAYALKEAEDGRPDEEADQGVPHLDAARNAT